MCADVTKVNGVRFFMSVFNRIFFCTAEYCENGKVDTFTRCIGNIQSLSARRGFRFVQFNMDGEFESLRTKTSNFLINLFSQEEHVPEAERNIRTVKDFTRSTLASLPFQRIPNRMLIELFFGQVFWLNAFPNKYVVSSTLSPCNIMTGKEIDYIKHCNIRPGKYV